MLSVQSHPVLINDVTRSRGPHDLLHLESINYLYFRNSSIYQNKKKALHALYTNYSRVFLVVVVVEILNSTVFLAGSRIFLE